MQKILYFDIVSDEGAGALTLLISDDGKRSFHYHYSASDLEYEKVVNKENMFVSFMEFWQFFTRDQKWFLLHPLYIHPEQRDFVRQQLKKVNWNIVEDEKWQDMYQRQWNKALTGPAEYYTPAKNDFRSL